MSNFMDVYQAMKGFERLVFHSVEATRSDARAEEFGYYTECGRYKPWSTATVRAAERRGLITVVKYLSDMAIFYVKPTEAGKELFAEIQERK